MVVLMVVPVVVVVVVVIVVVVVVVVVVMAAVPSYECQGGEGEARGAHARSADARPGARRRVSESRSPGPQSAAYLPCSLSYTYFLPARTHMFRILWRREPAEFKED